MNINRMVRGFIDAVTWADFDGDALFSPETLTEIRRLCTEFADGEEHLSHRPYGFGKDFYFTVAGHSVGFWDGDWPEDGERLTRKCQYYSFEFYEGDDGVVYML